MEDLRLIVIHRWAGKPTDDFYTWLAMSLGDLDPMPFCELQMIQMPTPELPIIDEWVAAIDAAVGPDPAERARTVLLGHSVGARAAIHYLSRLPPGERLAGLVAVAGWFTLEADWPGLGPWLDVPVDLARAAAAVDRCVALLSDDDPYTPDYTTNALSWEQAMGARVVLVPGAGHFHGPHAPEVLQALGETFA